MAPAVSKVLDPTGAGAETEWAAGVPYYWYDAAAQRWELQEPSSNPAQVINYSRGAESSRDDSLVAEAVDATVDLYGTTMTVAAGNSGPAAHTVNDPALAYNVIGVGAFSGGGTTDPSDDSVFSWSSRGPTVGGRKKPDLVAVGDGGLAYSYFETTGKLWKYDTGTSYAAPQVGGGAILLAGAGIRDPKVVKAILINSARQGRATPASTMGTQTGWQPDWGWGELNLDAAFRGRLNFARDEVPANSARFFKAITQAPGDRATLVWNRRVADCQPLRQGCYYDTDSGFRVHNLSNLDLTEYDAATQLPRAASASTVDNVEQVRAPAPGPVIYKVSAGDIDGSTPEPFAIAATRPPIPLVTPQPRITLALDAHGPVAAHTPTTVTATVTNPSPDLSAENAQATLTIPAGVELLSGAQTQNLGTLATNGAVGDSATASWTVRGTVDGFKTLIAIARASRYGSTFESSATDSFTVDAAPPAVTVAVPASASAERGIPVTWSATEQATFDIEVAIDDGPFTRWLTHATGFGAPYPAAAGSRYRFRLRATDGFGNTSPYVVTPVVAVPADRPTTPPPRPGDPPVTAPSPELRITAVRRRGRRLFVRGAVARGVNGKLTATWTTRVRRRRYVARATTFAQLREYKFTLLIPRGAIRARRGVLEVRYLGADGFARQAARLTVRSG